MSTLLDVCSEAGKGATFQFKTNLVRIGLEGYDGLVGIIDPAEKVFYYPQLNHMERRLEGVTSTEERKKIFDAYFRVSEVLRKHGYTQRYVSDF
jgi:hypothetical protein